MEQCMHYFNQNSYGRSGIFCEMKMGEGGAELTAKTCTENAQKGDLVQVTVRNEKGHIVACKTAQADREVCMVLDMPSRQMGQTVARLHEYSIAVELIRNEEVVDQIGAEKMKFFI